MEQINKLYKSAGKCDDQKQYKSILEATMVSTYEGLTENISLDVDTLVTLNNPSARNLLSKILTLLDVTQKTAVRWLGYAKRSAIPSEEAMIYGIVLIIGGDIKELIKVLKKLYIFGFYIILKLYNKQYTTSALKRILMFKLKKRLYPNWYCKCLQKNFTIVWWVDQNRRD